MGLPRLILLAIIIGGGVWLWRRIKSRPLKQAKPTQSQAMVRCAHCHVHLPENRATRKGQDWYCSAAHLTLGPKTRD